VNSELTEKTDIKEGRALDPLGRLASGSVELTARREVTAPRAGSFRGWILYDGGCRSCTASAKRFDRIFRRHGFVFLPLQTDWVMQRLGLEPGAPLEEMHVLTADGRDIGGADAVIFLARQIWWARPFAALARLPSMHKLLDRGYRWIATHRGCDHITCNLPPRRRWPGWIALIVFPSLALVARNHVAPWQFMGLMAGAIFLGCKWLTFWRARRHAGNLLRALGYLFAWPGMDAKNFLRSAGIRPRTPPDGLARESLSGKMPDRAGRIPALPDKRANIAGAIAKIFLGVVLLFGLARFAHQPLLAGWFGMTGIILILHFGIFDLLTVAWRASGIDARPIMNSPLKSASLGEFWGRRWNGAFNQLVFEILFRPLARITTPIIGTLAAFFASGLIHELVISLPARAGYGLPTAYFLLQGCGVLVQHRATSVRRGTSGRFFTILVVAGPAFWLFHPPFVRHVILPFMKAIGAL
jgi:predicted DCC family thiol-disulfide oxidoreductase YuxK